MTVYQIVALALLALALTAVGWAFLRRRRARHAIASGVQPDLSGKKEPTAPLQPRIVTIGGRQWRSLVRLTIEHDFWVLNQTEEAGISLYTKKGEDPGQFAARLLREVIASGKAFLLVGAFLIPDELEDQAWSPALAQQTADFMRKLEGEEDKAILQNAIISLLLGFFEAGLRLSNNFPTVFKLRGEGLGRSPQPANANASPS